jgi:DNA helicase II / ATP-dependent DNA helicase PcrA
MQMVDNFNKNYEKLNKNQKYVVDTVDGPLLVIAGPGSGKTQILSMRVANILKLTDTLPQSILCLTFTDAAAKNMVERLASIIGKEAYKVNIHTFHSFATDTIAKYPESFFGGSKFTPIDEITKVEILDTIFSKLETLNPLSSSHPELGWVYKKDVENLIKDLKIAGITPDEFSTILDQNLTILQKTEPIIQNLFSKTITKSTPNQLPEVIEMISKIEFNHEHNPRTVSYKKTVLEKLIEIYQDFEINQSSKPLTEFKNRYTKKDEDKILRLKDLMKLPYLIEANKVYKEYQNQLYLKGVFDFSDMIIEVNNALKTNSELRYNLQEQLQYILVDEFQDTNGAQLTLVQNLIDMELSEGRPNIMVVGDDDQAIYKFQGASVANIHFFYEMFDDVTMVQLETNYRSSGRIVDFSRQIINQGNKNQSGILDLTKKIQAFEQTRKSNIHHLEFETAEEEIVWIVEEIQNIVSQGVSADEIAVIARDHKALQNLANIAFQFKLPVNYEKGLNIFEQPHIYQLLVIFEYIASWIDNTSKFEKEELLPEILAFEFWQLAPKEIYTLSIESAKLRKTWMEVLTGEEGQKYSDKIQKIAKFILNLSISSVNLPAENLIDLVVGSVGVSISDNEQEEYDEKEVIDTEPDFISPFKEYYFPKILLTLDALVSQQYTTMLSGLRTFVNMVREFNPNSFVGVKELLELVNLYKKNNLSIIDTSSFVIQPNAVNIMTAHKSKGLEFKYVFVINANEENWKPGANRNKLPFPMNMNISSEPDEEDDVLRLLYVAITRAKDHLYLTRYTTANGKKTKKIRYLAEFEEQDFDTHDNPNSNLNALEVIQKQSQSKYNLHELRVLIHNQLENYVMSVTHLSNFLDLENAGPEVFLENNLLRFPQNKNPSSGYGTAMHDALRDWYVERSRSGLNPTKEYLFDRFKWGMKKERLDKNTKLMNQGFANLEYYLTNASFETDVDTEVPFRYEGVQVGEAILAGNIDKLVYEFRPMGTLIGECVVVDYKTGGGARTWKDLETNKPMKWFKYRQQLIFYKILVEKSRRFGDKYRVNAGKIDFIESVNTAGRQEHNVLEMEITDQEVIDLERLIQIVWKKIKTLDLPDVSGYSKDIKGTREFIQDLLNAEKT